MLTVLNYILLVFSTLYSIYLLWQITSWLIQPAITITEKELKTTVTVIVPCRNEEKNIGVCLQSILRQNYPSALLEIVIADDHSEDRTKEIAEGILKGGPFKWQYVQVADFLSNKKKAITAGIASSLSELIIITDGDCIVQDGWVASIVSLYEERNYQMICGLVGIVDEKGFCAKFQSLEITGLAVLAGAGISSNTPLLCNGANIAYTRKAFEVVNGFKEIDSIPTGDDTLLLFKINKQFPGQIGYLKNYNSVVYTQPQPTWHNLFQQRIRWASKGFISKNKLNSLVSAVVFITNFLLFIYIIGSLVYFSFNQVFITCLILKFTVDFLLLSCGTGFFKRKDLLFYFLAGEFVTMAYVSWVGLAANFVGYNWKGRDY